MRALIEFLFSILNILLRMWPVFREKDPIVYIYIYIEREREKERDHDFGQERSYCKFL